LSKKHKQRSWSSNYDHGVQPNNLGVFVRWVTCTTSSIDIGSTSIFHVF